MIDWLNLLGGFFLGVVGTGVFWFTDRVRAKNDQKRDAREEWQVAVSKIELLFYEKPPMTGGKLHVALTQYPIVRWRRILGHDGFDLLEQLQTALGTFDHFAEQAKTGMPTRPTPKRLEQAEQERNVAFRAFANFARAASSAQDNKVKAAEQSVQLRREFARHPIRTWKRERSNKRNRNTAGNL